MRYTPNKPLKFAGGLNIRELGGYVNEDGMRLKTHKLLRGDDLSNLTEEGIKELQEYGIKTSIDLRCYEEKIEQDPFYKSSALAYYSLPIKAEPNMQSASTGQKQQPVRREKT